MGHYTWQYTCYYTCHCTTLHVSKSAYELPNSSTVYAEPYPTLPYPTPHITLHMQTNSNKCLVSCCRFAAVFTRSALVEFQDDWETVSASASTGTILLRQELDNHAKGLPPGLTAMPTSQGIPECMISYSIQSPYMLKAHKVSVLFLDKKVLHLANASKSVHGEGCVSQTPMHLHTPTPPPPPIPIPVNSVQNPKTPS